MKDSTKGKITAAIAVIIWGSAPAVIITQYNYLKPMDVVLMEFLIGYIVFCFVERKPIKAEKKSHEIMFFLIGTLGITLTAGFMNNAYKFASSGVVSVIYSTSPLVLVLIYMIVKKKAYAGHRFWTGGLIAVLGCALVTMTGEAQEISFAGVALALAAAVSWALYLFVYDKIEKEGDYSINGILRRMFFYGFLTSLVFVVFTGTNLSFETVFRGHNVLILILVQGIFMGAVAYLLWNYSCKMVGAKITSIFIYGMPFVTMIVSWIVLSETLTLVKLLGCIVTIFGVFLSQTDKKPV